MSMPSTPQQTFSRADSSLLGQWWWTVDRWCLFGVLIIMGIGIILSMSASPAVANHLGLSPFYFVKRHLMLLPVAIMVMVGISLLNLKSARNLSLVLFLLSSVLMLIAFFMGAEIKGARRWISFLGFSLQPSEFVKPALAVLCAWMFGLQKQQPDVPGYRIATILFVVTVVLLAIQPDFGMIVVVSGFWMVQLFMTGIPMYWVLAGMGIGAGGLISAYFIMPHVAKRIDHFLDPSAGDLYGERYQIHRSLEAFTSGGWTGLGPGEGDVKKYIPDVHADFIFAVAREEFGLLFCWLTVGLFAFVVIRCLMRMRQFNSIFLMIATAGLISQFGFQTLINIASTLRLIPTKGMTLPFISYGGSSLLSSAITMGLVLCFTRRRVR